MEKLSVKEIKEIKSTIYEANLRPNEAAKYLVEQLGLEGEKEILITDVAKKVNIDIWEVQDIPGKNKNHEIVGYLRYITENKAEIIVKDVSYDWKRIIVAHEIAHFFLDNHYAGDVAFRTRFLHDPKKMDYNIFAINLLIPSFEDYLKVKQENYNSLLSAANHFGVPLSALVIYEQEEIKGERNV